ncbi:MAG: hypothetical protein BVN34_02360 [Proteobacteria bacterium ST_bin12]|nr:MAG: hypothetical protein BVN34_02360 [Proteobacteria bacterium ST_bin12]
MLNSIIRQPAILITLPLLTLIAASYPANAEIYKWRDNRGVTQYSDRPPASNFTKVTRNELVNALQTKDLCTVGPIQKSVASAKNLNTFFGFTVNKASTTSTNFFGIPVARAASTSSFVTNSANTPVNAGSVVSSPISSPVSAVKPTSTSSVPTASIPTVSRPATTTTPAAGQTSPLGIPTTFNSGSSNITVFGIPRANRNSGSSFLTQPAAVVPSSPVAAPAPAIAAPAPVIVPPVQVAVNTPAPLPAVSNAAPNLIQVGLMPAVDISKNVTPALGWNNLRINENQSPSDFPKDADGTGAFRIPCGISHMGNDDPIVYPNQPGAAHHHTFFGNTSLNYKSNLNTLSSTGNSTCHGGIANRSAYWIPSMIDTSTKTALKTVHSLWYYKSGYHLNRSQITVPPKNLRIIAGNMRSTVSQRESPWRNHFIYTCNDPNGVEVARTESIPACSIGSIVYLHIGFPQCWDGKNLDSPDHKSHMAYPDHACPATHPIAIPEITLNIGYKVTSSEGTKNWRLSSDNYAVNGYNSGFSIHADWVNGWDEAIITGIVKNCIVAGKNCEAHKLGDGRTIYGE